MYTLIERAGCTPEIVYATPGQPHQLVALVYNIRTKDAQIQFSDKIESLPVSALFEITKILE